MGGEQHDDDDALCAGCNNWLVVDDDRQTCNTDHCHFDRIITVCCSWMEVSEGSSCSPSKRRAWWWSVMQKYMYFSIIQYNTCIFRIFRIFQYFSYFIFAIDQSLKNLIGDEDHAIPFDEFNIRIDISRCRCFPSKLCSVRVLCPLNCPYTP